jgi:hypothetical protein
MPAACQPIPRQHPKPWHRDSAFVPPVIQRLTRAALLAWTGHVHAAHEQRVAARDGRRVTVLPAKRRDVALALVQIAGWGSQARISLEALAAAARTTVATVGRALNDLEDMRLVRRHRMLRRSAGGSTEQDISYFELLTPDPQIAEGRVSPSSGLASLAGRRARHMAAAVRRAVDQMLRKGTGPSSGDDEWARWNAERQIAALRGAP